jgi:hypothetical protein
MKAAEEYIKQFNLYEVVPLSSEPKIYFNERLKTAINEARKELLIECAERALLRHENYKGTWTEKRFPEDEYTTCTVDKQSILSLINELK